MDEKNTQSRKVHLRMKDKKRWPIALVLVAALAISMVGCGVSYGTSQNETALVSPAITPTQQNLEQNEGAVTTTPLPANEGAVHYSVETAATLPDTANRTALSTIDIYKLASPSVVAITTAGTTTSTDFFGQQRQVEVESAGSGVIISADGYILTCNHVVEGMDDVVVVTNDGKEYNAKVIGGDKTTDLAVLKVEATGMTPVTLGDSDALQVGELAVAIGNPLGIYANSQTTGTISGKDRALTVDDGNGGGVQMINMLQHDAAINPGNSGGGLFNSYGELVGITSAKSAGTTIEGMGFAIPINDAKAIINDLVNYGYVVRAQIGISGMTITEETAKEFNLPVGVYVADVVQGSSADKAGIVKGDVITKVDGAAVSGIEELTKLKNSKKVGDKLEMTIVHAGEEKTVSVTLEQEVQATPTPEPTQEFKTEVPEGLPEVFHDFFR